MMESRIEPFVIRESKKRPGYHVVTYERPAKTKVRFGNLSEHDLGHLHHALGDYLLFIKDNLLEQPAH
jgi:hypothetical protein